MNQDSRRNPYKPDWWKVRSNPMFDVAAQAHNLDPAHRLWMLAMGRAEQGGHAQFEPGEIRSLILKLNEQTGELSEYSDRNIKRWIAKLVEAGLIGDASTPECIVLPFPTFDSGVRHNPRPCKVHGHNLNWTPDGWIDPDTMWAEAKEAMAENREELLAEVIELRRTA